MLLSREKNRGAEDDLGLGDVISSLLTRLDLSWLGPEPEETAELLEFVLVFVEAMEGEDEKAEEEEDVCAAPKQQEFEEEEDGEVTKFIRGEWMKRKHSFLQRPRLQSRFGLVLWS